MKNINFSLMTGSLCPGQAWLAMIREENGPDVVVFENVERYPEDLLQVALGDLFEIIKAKLNPPDVFSVAMSRPRQYFLLYKRSTCSWVGPQCASWIEAMEPVMIPKLPVLDPEIFAADPDEHSTRRMTNSEKKHFKQYQELVRSGGRKDITVFDLRQSSNRPVTSLVDGSLPTLRTTSSSVYMVKKKEFLSGKQLLRAQGWPIHRMDSIRLGLKHVDWPDDLGNSPAVEMAGNAMFGPFPALAVMAALLFVEKNGCLDPVM